MYDKLPISAFVADPETPSPDMSLPNLQFWNCMDYGVVSVDKKFIGSMDFECYTRDHGNVKGTYICTIDNYHHDPDYVDWATSENPAEHKSHNLIELENGQYALYPNNRLRIYDNSLTPETPKMLDFKVSTQYYQVENGFDRLGMGREDEYFWKTSKGQRKRRTKMTPNNDFLDNLANDQYQKLIQEVYNDDMLKKTTKNKNNNELIERVDEEDSSEGKQV